MTVVGYFLLILCILFFLKPDILYKITVFLVPFTATSVLNTSVLGHAVGIQPVFLTGLFCYGSFIIKNICIDKISSFRLSKTILGYLLFSLIFLILCIISVAKHVSFYPEYTNIANSFQQISYSPFTQFGYLLFGMIFVFLIGVYNSDLEKLKSTFKIIVISGIFVSFWGLFQFITHILDFDYPFFVFNNSSNISAVGYGATLSLGATTIKRISSVATEPSILGNFLIIPFGILLITKKIKLTIFNKWIDRTSIVLLFCILLITTSSSAILSTIFLLLLSNLYIAIQTKKIRYFIYKCVVFLLIVGFIYTFIPMIHQYIDSYIFNKLSTFSGQDRLQSVLDSFNLFVHQPVFGFGFGSATSHDLVALLLSTTGILGFLTFIIFVLYLIFDINKQNFYLLKQQTINRELLSISMISFILLIAAMFYNEINGFSYVFEMFWLVLGICLASINIVKKAVVNESIFLK